MSKKDYDMGYEQALIDINKPQTVIQEAWTNSKCPRCKALFYEYEENDDGYISRAYSLERCPYCGQKLEWQ
jgi:DNA-directed RNA polymerase subunit RPC12/RpoP